MTQKDIEEGIGPPFAAARFLCRREDDESKQAFVRVYLQIPITGTEYASSTVRASQADLLTHHPLGLRGIVVHSTFNACETCDV